MEVTHHYKKEKKSFKHLWKAFKSLGPPNKSGGCITSALAENHVVKHNTKSILKTFYSNQPETLLTKLPKLPN